ncbi:hypothetical protein, partial [Bacillus safensis]|uniref:hypothetical protein n=1 Tax=Bacillus safensis TaxID=561879 RepID=UPI002E1EF6DB|nr:hypothetical protein [Bacillus safensis]
KKKKKKKKKTKKKTKKKQKNHSLYGATHSTQRDKMIFILALCLNLSLIENLSSLGRPTTGAET